MMEWTDFKPLIPQITAYAARTLIGLTLFFASFWVGGLVKRTLTRSMERVKVEPTLVRFTANIAKWGVIFAMTIATLGLLGVQTASFAAVIAASGLAIGLAFQGTLSNFAAGIMLMIFRPFRAGQVLRVGTEVGRVWEIDIFVTKIDTPDNRRLLIPNSTVFGGLIENLSHHPTRRIDIPVGVTYDADPEKARAILLDAVRGTEGVLADPPAEAVLQAFGQSSVDFMVRGWANTDDFAVVRDRLLSRVKRTLDEAGISIPFPQMDLHVKSPWPASREKS